MSAPTPETDPSTRRAAGIVGIAVVASRLLGLVREQVFAAMFGAGKLLDAYLAAFQIPNLLRDLFAEGALSTAFTTLFTRTWEKEGPPPAWALANLIFSAILFFLGSICLIGIAAAPWIIDVTNHGYHDVPGKFALTVSLTRLLFPFILFVSLAAAVMGILNSRHRFGLPASASTVFNVVSVVAGVAGAYLCDPGARANWFHPHFTERALYGVCGGVLLGGVAQLGMQLPELWRLGFRFRWRLELRNPRLREVWSLMWPSVIAGAAVQVNVLVNGAFASSINGGRSWLGCAFRLMQFPIGVFGVSIATALLPAVARHFAREEKAAFGHRVRDGLRLMWFLTVPAALGLAVLARPIIALIYQHGRFTAYDTGQTALALQAYAVGLCGYAALKILIPCFYVLGLPKLPLRVGLFGIALNLVLNTLMMRLLGFGHAGLALTTSLVALVNFAQLWFALSRRLDLGDLGAWLSYWTRLLPAAGLMALTAWSADRFLAPWAVSFPRQAAALAAAIGAAAAVYFAAGLLFRIEETSQAWGLIRRKILRR